MLSKTIAPIVGLVVTTSASITIDKIADQLIPSDMKAVPAFALKLGMAVVGGLVAGRIAQKVVEDIESVVDTVVPTESEEVPSEQEAN